MTVAVQFHEFLKRQCQVVGSVGAVLVPRHLDRLPGIEVFVHPLGYLDPFAAQAADLVLRFRMSVGGPFEFAQTHLDFMDGLLELQPGGKCGILHRSLSFFLCLRIVAGTLRQLLQGVGVRHRPQLHFGQL